MTRKYDYKTPDWLFSRLDNRFHFGLDAYASAENTLCHHYRSEEHPFEALTFDHLREMFPDGAAVWQNPPYDHGSLCAAVEHDRQLLHYARLQHYPLVIALLCPTKSDQAWHYLASSMATEINDIQGRIQFVGAKGGARESHQVFVFNSEFLGAHIIKSVQKEIQ